MRENATQITQNAANREVRAEKFCLCSLDMSYAMLVHGFWKKDPSALQLLRSYEELFTKKVLTIHTETYLKEFPLDTDSNEESDDKVLGVEHLAEAEA
uniref:Uncharacterized protein n=1 Tax=Cannabis sativa TaxID=3483 RepID=A0A803P8W9_CANSA